MDGGLSGEYPAKMLARGWRETILMPQARNVHSGDTQLVSTAFKSILDRSNTVPLLVPLSLSGKRMISALGHIKVLDLSRILAGPWPTQNLADMGAEVIKVERPRVGDDTRSWGPPFIKDATGQDTNDSAYFLSANRGKYSISVDLAKKEGQDIVRDLVKDADVLGENYKVGTLARYGLAYDDLRQVNPRLVYCSITGFGQTDPCASLPGYDYIFQGMGGLMSITGIPDGEPGADPMKSGLAVCDIFTGMYAATAILAALEHRHVSGQGQYIDLLLLDCIVGITSYQALNYFLSKDVPQRMGNAHPNMVPYQVFRCKVGDIIVAVGNDDQFREFCKLIDRTTLGNDPRFISTALRSRNREELIPRIAEAMLAKTMEQWVALLKANNVPCGSINDIKQVFEDPQVEHRQMHIELPHSIGGSAAAIANAIRLSETPIQYRRSCPGARRAQ
jgi:crotonobetainyl-CoA:carnitine CoA-transferase CaiB-like acyl-CoA transferase